MLLACIDCSCWIGFLRLSVTSSDSLRLPRCCRCRWLKGHRVQGLREDFLLVIQSALPLPFSGSSARQVSTVSPQARLRRSRPTLINGGFQHDWGPLNCRSKYMGIRPALQFEGVARAQGGRLPRSSLCDQSSLQAHLTFQHERD